MQSLYNKGKRYLIRASLVISTFLVSFACRTTESPYYKVKVNSGDTLTSIAQRFGTSWDSIARLNHIADYRFLKVGEILFVKPGPGGWVARGSAATDSYLGQVSELDYREAMLVKRTNSSTPAEVKSETKQKAGGGLFGKGQKLKELIWPTQGSISSSYGQRGRRFHYGIDIKATLGSSIRAAKAGKVVYSGRRGAYGKLVIIEHPDNSQTYYAHCSRLIASKGSWVPQGKRIATVGQTGNATGTHLHFEVRAPDGEAVNPLSYLPSNSNIDHLVSL